MLLWLVMDLEKRLLIVGEKSFKPILK